MLTAIASPTAAAEAHDGVGLNATAPVVVAGETVAATSRGALHVNVPIDQLTTSIQAGVIDLELRWEQGFEGGAPDRNSLVRYATAADTERATLREGTIQIGPLDGPVELLVFPTDAPLHLVASSIGETIHAYPRTPYLTQFGAPPDTAGGGGGSPLSFWYPAKQDWISARGADTATVSGQAWLFVTNATVKVEQDSEVVWSGWAGFRRTDVGQAAYRYEEHLLLLRLSDVRMTLAAPEAVSLFGSELAVDVIGIISSRSVEGSLDAIDGPRLFSGEPIEMRGEGHLTLAGRAPSNGGQTRPMALALAQGAQLEVRGGTPVTDAQGGVGSAGGVLTGARLWTLAGVALVSVVLVARSGVAGQGVAAWRTRRYSRHVKRGRALVEQDKLDGAASHFRRATRARPDGGTAWYYLALTTLEAGRYDAALAVVDGARGRPGVDALDLLEVEVEAALRAGRTERARAALDALALASAEMAATLLEDLGVEGTPAYEELRSIVAAHRDREVLPGYA